ncbi:hypothetical protein D1632_06035 [Chryseobacterium nematophagum]|uniref:Uncharacterized protein n=1 Tax=Chryseobacterium nematophagum TaxID=2305228 RepID=A0A3M7LCM3_9FLAO|nr:hypothetical protein [Chryseobacterium nematophagum]RMZ59206.1 hypothetical protein D1632_06035 [Chryseobacterium nematophagum]
MKHLFISFGEEKEIIDHDFLGPSLKRFQRPLTREEWIEDCKSVGQDDVDGVAEISRTALTNKKPDKVKKLNYSIIKGVITAR